MFVENFWISNDSSKGHFEAYLTFKQTLRSDLTSDFEPIARIRYMMRPLFLANLAFMNFERRKQKEETDDYYRVTTQVWEKVSLTLIW